MPHKNVCDCLLLGNHLSLKYMAPGEGFPSVLHLLQLQNRLQQISEWKLLLILLKLFTDAVRANKPALCSRGHGLQLFVHFLKNFSGMFPHGAESTCTTTLIMPLNLRLASPNFSSWTPVQNRIWGS